MKKGFALAAMAAMTLAIVVSGKAAAHGSMPKHGGMVQETRDGINVELAGKDGKAMLYLEDHGKALASAGASARLTVLKGSEKTEVAMEPAGDNVLASKGEVILASGAKVIATITFADKRTTSARFSVK